MIKGVPGIGIVTTCDICKLAMTTEIIDGYPQWTLPRGRSCVLQLYVGMNKPDDSLASASTYQMCPACFNLHLVPLLGAKKIK